MSNFLNFSERLKEERISKGLSQEAFGIICGVKKQAQFNYEKGERKPDIEYLMNLYKAGVDVNYIITGERSTSNPFTKSLVDAFFKADELTQQMITKLLGLDLNNAKTNTDQKATGTSKIIGSNNFNSDVKIKIVKKREEQ